MPPKGNKILGAMFDVRPVRTGSFGVEKKVMDILDEEFDIPSIEARRTAAVDPKSIALREFEEALNEKLDSQAELTQVGGKVFDKYHGFKPRQRPIVGKKDNHFEGLYYHRILSAAQLDKSFIVPFLVKETAKPTETEENSEDEHIPGFNRLASVKNTLGVGSSEIESFVSDFYNKSYKSPRRSPARMFKNSISTILLVAVVVAGITYFWKSGFDVKNEVVKNGDSAVKNLENAEGNLRSFNFASASYDFAKAYQEFSRAGENLNFISADISSLLAELPGADKLKSAKNLAEAGRVVSGAGQNMSNAMEAIAKTGALLEPTGAGGVLRAGIAQTIKDALITAERQIGEALGFLVNVDDSLIPENKRPMFVSFKNKLPEIQRLTRDGIGYANFLTNLIGNQGTKRYLLLFQNYSELRPTGGFVGSYGILTFQDGVLKDFFVDDAYNLDGQIKENIIPPKPLQHITPTWAMRDANWFVDFPASAKKTAQFYKKESGSDVDGVITISPKILVEMLNVIGPVALPSYKLVLDSNNFLASLQTQIEYGENRTQPKQILVDLAPELLKRIYSTSQSNWLKIFNILATRLEQKDVLMYFKDLSLENFAIEKGFGGQVAGGDFDSVMVNIANVRGSKSDLVTSTSLKVSTIMQDGAVKHRIFLTRRHNGGSSALGFYNKQSPAYVRVLAPDGSTFSDIVGNSNATFSPLINYANAGFAQDPDLVAIEKGEYLKDKGVSITSESGKTVFGFWMIVNPGETKTVELEYSIPLEYARSDYKLLVQKQPGLTIDNFEFVLDVSKETQVVKSLPLLSQIGSLYSLDMALDKDLLISIGFK
ncbi:MAG: hypothetical protein A2750_01835 [Candidatus Yanofskybacteria bacterium RIFCSPHIGHO2_01_FULL_45_42]|uniref:DUF4012 domain-containing protein n=3 Tax=Candidatus Yanofskyibacteriota TaxID=1752733 RepID=A0A1F8F5N4_9BACT|nr:MAG: hypothetical protein A2750_01835 [Candidatus Yanofskybacteria bacterium RIFCSPHIGHO2_01_FULL_45_42]OGN27254.1 MAG: hypothetical protein A3B17_00635 [Candidatus Yanofskybacteria bacterium RIFCSPLOWO2_01_FULL_45_72]